MTEDKVLDREAQTREFLKKQAVEQAKEKLPLNLQRMLDEAALIEEFVKEAATIGISTGIKIRELKR